jgi:hypothetical protein
MVRRPSEFTGIISRNGSLFVAISSATIALMSLWLTIDSTRRDRRYREVSIQPSLVSIVEPTELSARVENYGFGPAKIKRIIADLSDGCYDSDSYSDMEELNRRINRAIQLHLGTDIFFEAYWRLGRSSGRTPYTKSQYFIPGEVIKAGGAKLIFEFYDADEIRRLREDILKLGAEHWEKVSNEFKRRASTMPISTQYCSLTGETCAYTSTLQKCKSTDKK